MQEHQHPSAPPEPTLEDFQRARALPPPAFPPGFRRVSVRRRLERQGRREIALTREGAPFPDGAFISPDDPIDRPTTREAYISPDDPLPVRGARVRETEEFDPDEVVVTGMGDDPHLGPERFSPADDPDLAALAGQVQSLAEALQTHGEAGLREYPGMSRFEATLRAYCVGYLQALRADESRN